jgi:hypothetical protein
MDDGPQPPTQHDLDRVLELERELQTPTCRADPARLRELLAPDFVEIGASGRRWDLDSTLTMLDEETAEGSAVIEMSALQARALAPGVVQVFWGSDRDGRRARRTSIWCAREHGWQQVYHQGTLLA